MSTYKLTYFDIRGKAELTRLILAQAGVEYEDIRIGQDEWRDHLKSSKITARRILSLNDRPYPDRVV